MRWLIAIVALLPEASAADPERCRAEPVSGPLALPAHAAWTHWKLDRPTPEIRLPVEVVDDPGSGAGLYFVPWSGRIGGTQMYLGLQTDVWRPGVGGAGKGVIFSRWGRKDEADVRVAPGGFSQISGHEGDFVGVRILYGWKRGSYTLVLARESGDEQGDWYRLDIDDGRSSTWVGSLRIPRADPQTPGLVAPEGTAFIEVYSGARSHEEVPTWHVAVTPAAEGARLVSATSEYPAFPHAGFPNADVWLDPISRAVHLAFGRTVGRCHPAGVLATGPLPTP
jgi:hypothetical protein